jgi:hypothetical protein
MLPGTTPAAGFTLLPLWAREHPPGLYQLIRQPRPITDRTLEITFLDAGAQACAFTCGQSIQYPPVR